MKRKLYFFKNSKNNFEKIMILLIVSYKRNKAYRLWKFNSM